jgi:hypothetical protein
MAEGNFSGLKLLAGLGSRSLRSILGSSTSIVGSADVVGVEKLG